jgi:hypothetical protein
VASLTVSRKTVKRVTRLRNTVNGNARYAIEFTDGTRLQTKADSAFVFGISNDLEGREVEIQIDGRGCLTDLEPSR